MAGRVLLDTNVVIALFDGQESVRTQMAEADEVFVSSVVLGELYFGASKSSRVADNLDRIDDFASSTAVLNCDARTAREYGAVKSSLRRRGRPIPENDIWVAATALQNDLVLATRDDHFAAVEGLRCEEW